MTAEKKTELNRRQMLQGTSAFGLGALVLPWSSAGRLAAALGDQAKSPRGPAAACTLIPQQTEGPYYFNAALLRQDITEGRPGLPLLLALQVVRAATCAPIPNAVVDIWHCDALGLYAGYSGQPGNNDTTGQNWFRGIQVTDANGNVGFQTVYPGWYMGRTVHIHVEVHLANQTVATSQLYFPDVTTDQVLARVEPYNARGQRSTTNANDGLYSPLTVLNLSLQPGALVGTFTIGIA